MSSRRTNDPLDSRSRFRTERIVNDGGEWYFLTREGSVEGPFRTHEDAERRLEMYIRMATHNMLHEGDGLALVE